MSYYLLIRNIHITCAVVTAGLFVLRGLLQVWGVDWRARWPVLRWLPHVNDSLLLGAGLTLMPLSGQYPDAAHPWLTGKLILLLLYIGAGAQALRDKRPRVGSATWFFVAIACLAGILTLATARPGTWQGPTDICVGQRPADAVPAGSSPGHEPADRQFHVE